MSLRLAAAQVSRTIQNRVIPQIGSAIAQQQRCHSSETTGTANPPKFYQLPYPEKRKVLIAEKPALGPLFEAADRVDLAYLEKHSEMMVAAHSLALSIVRNVTVNGNPKYSFVLANEERSVAAGLNAMNQIIFRNGGYIAIPAEAIMSNHAQLIGPQGMTDEEALRATHYLTDKIPTYLKALNTKLESMHRRTGGFLYLEVFPLPPTNPEERWMFELRGTANVGDSEGAVYLTASAEFLRDLAAKETGLIPGMGILCQNGENRLATAKIRLNPEDLTVKGNDGRVLYTGKEVAQRMVWGNQFSWRVKGGLRSDTEAKGALNYQAGQALATGGDGRAFGMAYGRHATKGPIAKGWLDHEGFLNIQLTTPTVAGTVGGDRSPQDKLAIALTGAENAKEMSMLSVSGGVAQHAVALKVLMTTGITVGHSGHIKKMDRLNQNSQV